MTDQIRIRVIASSEIVAALRKRGISSSASLGWYGIYDFAEKGVTSALRFSPHYYNTEEEVDAGVAALFAGGVSEFSHFGFGGEAPILIRTPEGKVISIAGVGTAPKLMTREFFAARRASAQDSEEALRRGKGEGAIPSYGLLPTLVPGMVDAGLLALKEYGTKSFEEAIQPALDLAIGFPIDNQRAQSIAQAGRFLQAFPTSFAVYAPDAMIPRPGDIFIVNDPYLGGTHLPDIAIVMPAFHETAIAVHRLDAVALVGNGGDWLAV